MNVNRRFALFIFLLSILAPARAEGVGVEAAAAEIASRVARLPLSASKAYELSEAEARDFIDVAAVLRVNLLELLDGAYRYLAPRGFRIRLSGDSLRKAEAEFDLGKERVRALLPVEKMISLELGAAQAPGQRAMEVSLFEPYSEYIEIGTILLDTNFGFASLSPGEFRVPYGASVRRLVFTSSLDRIELYDVGKAAIYVKGLARPKKWNIWIVRRK